jgi:TRAP-type mannitol/chloroaromatic compound transport system permease large subunit
MAEVFAVAMVLAVCGLLLAGYPVALTLAGVSLLFAAGGAAAGMLDFSLLGALPERIYGVMTNDVLLAIPLFIFMGVMLERSRIAEELLETMGRLFGALPGGLGLSVIVVGVLLAAAKGIVGATAVTMGLSRCRPCCGMATTRRSRRGRSRPPPLWRRFFRRRRCWSCSATS